MSKDGGDGEGWRFAEQTAAQVAAGWSLREQVLWRVSELTNAQSINLAEHAEHFPEVLSGLTLEGFEPVLRAYDEEAKLVSKASLEDGGMLRLTGALQRKGEYVAFFMRRLALEQGWAIHERLVVDPRFRGYGIGPRFVQSSLTLYDALGLELVSATAALETGRWFWAHMGFEFALPWEAERVREWAQSFCEAVGIEASGLEEISAAGQFARLEAERPVCFEELALAMPEKNDELAEIAAKNDFALDKPMPLGQAVMLSGPEWTAHLRLHGAQRRSFEAAVSERIAKAERRAEAELAGSAATGLPGAFSPAPMGNGSAAGGEEASVGGED